MPRPAAVGHQIAAADWAARLGESHTLEIPTLAEISDTALTRDVAIAMGEDGLPNTFVPGRNLVFLTFAAALAYRRGIRHIIGGMCETDYSGYPDCRDETIKALQSALNLGMAKNFELHTPLMWLDKASTWKLAHELGGAGLVDLIREHSHTCYLGERGAQHDWGYGCGECPACALRAKGWREYAGRSLPARAHYSRRRRPPCAQLRTGAGDPVFQRPVFEPISRGVLDTRLRGYDDWGGAELLPEIPRRQLDRRAVGRAVGGVVPGVAIAMQGIRCRDALGGDERFQRGEPVPVIGLAGVGIAFGLRALDLRAQRLRPFLPGEDAGLVQRQRHGEGARLPRLAKYRAVLVAGHAGDGDGRPHRLLRGQIHHTRSR